MSPGARRRESEQHAHFLSSFLSSSRTKAKILLQAGERGGEGRRSASGREQRARETGRTHASTSFLSS